MNNKIIFSIAVVSCSFLWTGCKSNAQNVIQTMDEPTIVLTPTVIIESTPTINLESRKESTLTVEPEVTKEPTPTIIEEDNWFNRQIGMIYQDYPLYKDYVMETYPFDNVYVVVFQPPTAKKEFLEYFCDVWVLGDGSCTKVEKNAYISYNSFQTGTIDEKSYFRYDLSYATDSVTILLMMDDQNNLQKFSLGGNLHKIEGCDITVTHSSYDMIYYKADGFPSGHTWKPFYYYLKDYELVAYEMKEIEKDQFLSYKNATEIMETITSKYSNPKEKLSMVYLSVENGLIIVNIKIESIDSISYYYETYQVDLNQTLELVESGEGTYAGLMLDETKFVKIIDYSDEDNTVTAQIVEWLCPWKEEDKVRIQQLIDLGEIEDSDAVWESEFYLYTNNNEQTFDLADQVKISFRDQDTNLYQMDKDILKEDLSNLLLSIKISNDEIYEITEPYMP